MQHISISNLGSTLSNARDGSVIGIVGQNNKKILYLPENIVKVFPNLWAYNFHDCAIRELIIGNFQGLTKLREINVHLNQIEKIPPGIFDGLLSLEQIRLGKF